MKSSQVPVSSCLLMCVCVCVRERESRLKSSECVFERDNFDSLRLCGRAELI